MADLASGVAGSVIVPGIPGQLRAFSWCVPSTAVVDSSISSSCLRTARHPFRALLLVSTVDSILYRTGVRVVPVRVCAKKAYLSR